MREDSTGALAARNHAHPSASGDHQPLSLAAQGCQRKHECPIAIPGVGGLLNPGRPQRQPEGRLGLPGVHRLPHVLRPCATAFPAIRCHRWGYRPGPWAENRRRSGAPTPASEAKAALDLRVRARRRTYETTKALYLRPAGRSRTKGQDQLGSVCADREDIKSFASPDWGHSEPRLHDSVADGSVPWYGWNIARPTSPTHLSPGSG